MGVPSFFAWWASHCPEKILFKSITHDDIVLYLDFNGAIHPAVRTDTVMEYQNMPAAVLAYLDKLINYVKPKEVWLAIDGVAPVAKMSQQRDRRFKSAKEAKHKRELAIECGHPVRDDPIDFNMISPGTEFMDNLEQYLVSQIKENTKKGMKWYGIKFTISGSCIPGEGEHKIMDEIRRRKSESQPSKGSKPSKGSQPSKGSTPSSVNCIYGLDADLLFLALINDPECIIVRENVQFRLRDEMGFDPVLYPYIYLDVGELRDCVCELLGPSCSIQQLDRMKFKYNKKVLDLDRLNRSADRPGGRPAPIRDLERPERLILDYVYICFLLGNDFIPRLPCLKIRNGSLNDIVVLYKLLLEQTGDYLIGSDLTVNRKFFYSLIGCIADLEDEFMLDMADQRYKDIGRFKYRLHGKNAYEKAVEEFDYVENQYRDTIMGGTKGWRKRYYQYHIGINCHNDKELQRKVLPLCQAYLEGMNWVLQYYIGWNKNWTWHYPFDAAPTALDLYLSNLNLDYDFRANSPVEPYVQLLSILPPESAQLLPAALRPLMVERDSPVLYMYPLKITLSLIGNKFWHECKPRMPLVDHQLLKDVVSAKIKYMTEAERERNRVKTPIQC